jgi:hypothetical protein
MRKRMNLVLQGSGVRGIAYVGALESLPPDIALHTVIADWPEHHDEQACKPARSVRLCGQTNDKKRRTSQ